MPSEERGHHLIVIQEEEWPVRFARAKTYATTGAWDVMDGRKRIGTATPHGGAWWAHHANGIFLGEAPSRRAAAQRILMADVTFP